MDAARGTKQMEKYIFLSRNTSLPNVSSHTSLPDATETHYCCCCATQKCIALLREKPHRRSEALNDMFEVMKVFCCVLPLNLVLYHSPLCVFVRFALFSSVLQKKQQKKKRNYSCMTVSRAVMTPSRGAEQKIAERLTDTTQK